MKVQAIIHPLKDGTHGGQYMHHRFPTAPRRAIPTAPRMPTRRRRRLSRFALGFDFDDGRVWR